GQMARVDITVFAPASGVYGVFLFQTGNAQPGAGQQISWTFAASLTPATTTAGSFQTLTASYALPAGTLQAVRAIFAPFGSAAPATLPRPSNGRPRAPPLPGARPRRPARDLHADTHTDVHADGDGFLDSYSDAPPDAYRDLHENTVSNHHVHADGDSHFDSHENTDRNRRDADLHSNSDPDGNPDANADENPDSDEDAHQDAHRLSDSH